MDISMKSSKTRTVWTKQETVFLQENYGVLTSYQIAKKLNKTRSAIINRARKLTLNIGSFWKGKKLTESHKNKFRNNPKRGHRQPHSKETRIKMAKSHCGEKSHFWKGGVTPVRDVIHHSTEYTLWREAVFYRDNFTCRACGQRGNYLEAHHILSFSGYPHKRFDISNGMTLCKVCHKKTDNYGKHC